MTKKGFISFGLIAAIIVLMMISMTVLSMSINISDISLYKNRFDSYGYTVKSSHAFVYMKIEGYYRDSFIKACMDIKNSYSSYSPEQIVEEHNIISDDFKKRIKFNMDTLKIYTIPMDFNHADFADCTYSMEKYNSLLGKSLIYILVKSRYEVENINRAYLKEYYIELPELNESDIARIMDSDFEGVYNEHEKSLRTGREFYGY